MGPGSTLSYVHTYNQHVYTSLSLSPRALLLGSRAGELHLTQYALKIDLIKQRIARIQHTLQKKHLRPTENDQPRILFLDHHCHPSPQCFFQ